MSTLFMRFPKGRKKALTLSYDDAVIQDVRLIEIMQKNGLKGTFNLNSGLFAKEGTSTRRMTKEQALQTFTHSGMEIAAHGLTHPALANLLPAQCSYEVIRDRENLEGLFHDVIRGLAYPDGSYSDEVVECLKNAGIVYARTTISSGTFRVPTDWLRLEPTCRHRELRLMTLAKEFIEQEVTRDPWLFYLWGHSYEFDDDDNWNVIEEFAGYTGRREDIWYATNIEIYEYVEAYHRLVISVDGCIVKNPTNFELYFERNGKIHCIKPGEILKLEQFI